MSFQSPLQAIRSDPQGAIVTVGRGVRNKENARMKLLVTTSKAPVPRSDALVTTSFLLLLVRHLFLIANIVTTSKALVTSSDALLPSSFLLLLDPKIWDRTLHTNCAPITVLFPDH